MGIPDEDDDELYLQNLWEAGAIGSLQASIEDDYPELTSKYLHQQLEMLSTLRKLEPASSTCDWSSIPEVFQDTDVLRCYTGESCSVLFVVFAGLATGADWDDFEFVGTSKRAGLPFVLFLKDPEKLWYMRTPWSRGDPFGQVVAVISREVDRLKPQQLVLIGSSAGGYAAMRAGINLGATVVLAFGPQVFITPEQRVALQLPEKFFDAEIRRCAALGLPMESIVDCCRHDCASSTLVEVHVGQCDVGDVKEARLLEEAFAAQGQHNVVVHIHGGLTHGVAKGLRSAGFLDSLFGKYKESSTEDMPTTACKLPPGMRERFGTRTYCKAIDSAKKRQHARMLRSNLALNQNAGLRDRVLSGEVSAEDLVKMDSNHLAPEALQAQRQEIQKKMLKETIVETLVPLSLTKSNSDERLSYDPNMAPPPMVSPVRKDSSGDAGPDDEGEDQNASAPLPMATHLAMDPPPTPFRPDADHSSAMAGVGTPLPEATPEIMPTPGPDDCDEESAALIRYLTTPI